VPGEFRTGCDEEFFGNLPTQDAQHFERLNFTLYRGRYLLGCGFWESTILQQLHHLADIGLVVIRESLAVLYFRRPQSAKDFRFLLSLQP